jgi:hypothetical protein
MTSLIISQLLQAVLVIVVTVITVRYTQLGSMGISHQFRTKLLLTSQKILLVVGPLILISLSALMLYVFLHSSEQPITRTDVFYIAFWAAAFLMSFGEFARTIGQVWRFRNL